MKKIFLILLLLISKDTFSSEENNEQVEYTQRDFEEDFKKYKKCMNDYFASYNDCMKKRCTGFPITYGDYCANGLFAIKQLHKKLQADRLYQNLKEESKRLEQG